MTPIPSTDDDPRDAHLVAALRHAPDRDLAPPAHVTEHILGEARRAVRSAPPRRPAWRERLRSTLAGLWQPAPMAAFGTLAMATLIGVLWVGHEPPDATPALRPDRAMAPPVEARSDASAAVAPAPAPVPQAVDGMRETAKADLRPVSPKSALVTKPVAPPTVAAAGARPDAAVNRRAERKVQTEVASQQAAPAPVVPAPAAVAQANVAAGPPRQTDALGKSLADVATPAARVRNEAGAPAATGSALGIAAPLAATAGEIDAAAAADSSRVRWRVAPQRLVAHDAAQREWWSALALETRGRWQRAVPGATSVAESMSITLLIDGAPRGSVGFEPQALIWRDASGEVWRAPVAAETSRAWQEAVARW